MHKMVACLISILQLIRIYIGLNICSDVSIDTSIVFIVIIDVFNLGGTRWQVFLVQMAYSIDFRVEAWKS